VSTAVTLVINELCIHTHHNGHTSWPHSSQYKDKSNHTLCNVLNIYLNSYKGHMLHNTSAVSHITIV